MIHRGSLASLSSVVHAQISRRSLAFFAVSDFISMSLLEHQSHGIYTYKNVCVEERKNCKTRTPACNGTTACYRIGCIIVLLLFTASTFLIVSHAQEQMSSLVSPTRTLRTFSNHSDRGVTSFTLACRASRSCCVIPFPYSFFFYFLFLFFFFSARISRLGQLVSRISYRDVVPFRLDNFGSISRSSQPSDETLGFLTRPFFSKCSARDWLPRRESRS